MIKHHAPITMSHPWTDFSITWERGSDGKNINHRLNHPNAALIPELVEDQMLLFENLSVFYDHF